MSDKKVHVEKGNNRFDIHPYGSVFIPGVRGKTAVFQQVTIEALFHASLVLIVPCIFPSITGSCAALLMIRMALSSRRTEREA